MGETEPKLGLGQLEARVRKTELPPEVNVKPLRSLKPATAVMTSVL
jgi:hypothetical protein